MKAVECKEYPGYYEIPGFSKYCVSKTSEIFLKTKKRVIKQKKVYGSGSSKKETGYYLRVTMYDDDGKCCSPTVHRIMAIVFKYPVGQDISKLQVNHINGIKRDNSIDNLEWVTCKENIRQSNRYYGTRVKVPVQLKEGATGKVFNFATVGEAAKFLGIHRTTLIARIEKYRSGFVFPDGFAARYGNEDTEWLLSTKSEEEVDLFYTKPLLIKNLITNEIVEVPSLKAAREYIPYTPAGLCNILNDETQPTVWGKKGHVYLIIRKYPKKEFRNVKDPYHDLAISQTNKRVVIAVNVRTNEKRIYVTTKQCADDFNILITTLNARLKRNLPKVFNDWIFRYYEEQGRLSGNG